MYFSSTDIIGNNPIKADESFSQNYIKGNTVSCFMTDSKIVICLNLILEGLLYQFHIIALNQNLEELKTKNLNYHMISDYSYFYKCIHLKEETGVFIFYRAYHVVTEMITKPLMMFKTYDSDSNSFNNYLSFDEIELDLFEFNIDSLLNDLIKISDNKLCFVSTSEDKENLYIALIKIMNKNSVIARYYSIAIYKLYNHKLLSENRLHLYNNYISFAFSFITKESFINTDFMIFSYDNGEDYDLDIIDFLFNNNNITIDDIEINLNNYIKIDNNQKSEYESKMIYYNIIINKSLKKECDEINFQLCLQNFPNNYEKRKICEHPEMTDIESTFISDIITNQPETTEISTIIETDKNDKACTNEQILNNNAMRA
jgi:hypothetical protein